MIYKDFFDMRVNSAVFQADMKLVDSFVADGKYSAALSHISNMFSYYSGYALAYSHFTEDDSFGFDVSNFFSDLSDKIIALGFDKK